MAFCQFFFHKEGAAEGDENRKTAVENRKINGSINNEKRVRINKIEDAEDHTDKKRRKNNVFAYLIRTFLSACRKDKIKTERDDRRERKMNGDKRRCIRFGNALEIYLLNQGRAEICDKCKQRKKRPFELDAVFLNLFGGEIERDDRYDYAYNSENGKRLIIRNRRKDYRNDHTGGRDHRRKRNRTARKGTDVTHLEYNVECADKKTGKNSRQRDIYPENRKKHDSTGAEYQTVEEKSI